MEICYQRSTELVDIKVIPQYVEEKSIPRDGYYFFSYHVKITNNNMFNIKLMNRKWIINDGNGSKEEVEGEGVIGKQPVILPGHSFSYMSFCPLSTPTGNMRGHYQFEKHTGGNFIARVPLFFFRHPSYENNQTH